MRKFVWSMLVLLSVGWGSASAQEIVSSDTTVCEVNQTPQPTDDHYRIVTNRFGTTGLFWQI